MGTLNAVPNQNPFAFECNTHYRTQHLIFHVALKIVDDEGAIIDCNTLKTASSVRLAGATTTIFPVSYTWQPNANCPTS
jgi:hypothetical protein